MNPMLNQATINQLSEVFAQLQRPVEIALFQNPENEETSAALAQLFEELCALSEKLHLRHYHLPQDAEQATRYHLDKTPGFALLAVEDEQHHDYGIRFAGFPGQYEFTSLINSLMMVSQGDSQLSAETRSTLAALTAPLHLMVFVTPTCPYCPRAVILAHQMALESRWVEAEMVEATDFPALAERYAVSSVPHTIINHGQGEWIGALPEPAALHEILHTLKEEK